MQFVMNTYQGSNFRRKTLQTRNELDILANNTLYHWIHKKICIQETHPNPNISAQNYQKYWNKF